jgi:hypothetical protein
MASEREQPRELLEEVTRGEEAHTPFTVHLLVFVAIAAVVAIVTAVLLALYFWV